MTKIFIISGLGTDERVFKNLEFPGYEVVFIQWIHAHHEETLQSYAKRLTEQITEQRPILVGLSFGGLVAVEVSKIVDLKKLILIASAKNYKEIPYYFRLAGYLNLHKIVPARLFKSPHFLTNWFFGIENDKDKKLLAEILHDTDSRFLKWAVDKIVKWRNQSLQVNFQHIHGTTDRILPFRYIKADIAIEKGGHFMTVSKAAEINCVIKALL